jgi:hypothetical protein
LEVSLNIIILLYYYIIIMDTNIIVYEYDTYEIDFANYDTFLVLIYDIKNFHIAKFTQSLNNAIKLFKFDYQIKDFSIDKTKLLNIYHLFDILLNKNIDKNNLLKVKNNLKCYSSLLNYICVLLYLSDTLVSFKYLFELIEYGAIFDTIYKFINNKIHTKENTKFIVVTKLIDKVINGQYIKNKNQSSNDITYLKNEIIPILPINLKKSILYCILDIENKQTNTIDLIYIYKNKITDILFKEHVVSSASVSSASSARASSAPVALAPVALARAASVSSSRASSAPAALARAASARVSSAPASSAPAASARVSSVSSSRASLAPATHEASAPEEILEDSKFIIELKFLDDKNLNIKFNAITFDNIQDIIHNLLIALNNYKILLNRENIIDINYINTFITNYITIFEIAKTISADKEKEFFYTHIYDNYTNEEYFNINIIIFKLLNTLYLHNINIINNGIKICELFNIFNNNKLNYNEKIITIAPNKQYFINVIDNTVLINHLNMFFVINKINFKTDIEKFKTYLDKKSIEETIKKEIEEIEETIKTDIYEGNNLTTDISNFIEYIKIFMDKYVLKYINSPEDKNLIKYYNFIDVNLKNYFNINLIYILDFIQNKDYSILSKYYIIYILQIYIDYMKIINNIVNNNIVNNNYNYLILAISIEFINLLNKVIIYLQDDNESIKYINIQNFNTTQNTITNNPTIVTIVRYDYINIDTNKFINNYTNLKNYLISENIVIKVLFKNLIESMAIQKEYIITLTIIKEKLLQFIEKKITGGANKYKKTGNKATIIYKKKEYTRVIYICERKKYIKINKTFMLLSKLKKYRS